MQIDDEKESSKSDRSDTSYNSSTASECHTEDEFVQTSRSFTCSDIDSKHVKPKRKPRRLTRRIRNQKQCKNKLMNIQDVSSDQSNGKANRGHVSNKNVTAKEKPITDTYSRNTDEKSAEGNGETHMTITLETLINRLLKAMQRLSHPAITLDTMINILLKAMHRLSHPTKTMFMDM